VPDQGHAAPGPKVHIGLVHDHHPVGVAGGDLPDGLGGQGQAGGGVGVGDDDGLVQVIVPGRVQGEVLFQRDDVLGDVHQAAPDPVAAVGDVGPGQRAAGVAESPQGKEQVFVAAVAGHDLVRLQLIIFGGGLAQLQAVGVGV